MKKNIVGILVVALAILNFAFSQTASASSLETIQQQQEQKKNEISSLQQEVNSVLEEVSLLSQELDTLDQQIVEKEVEIKETEAEVVAQEEIVEARMEQARQRLQALQLNEMNSNIIITILESESLSDLFNRTLMIMKLTDAGNQQLESAEEEVQILVELQEKLLASQEDLESQLLIVSERKETYDGKVSSLQALIQENQSELTTLIDREEKEVARIEEARRRAREEAEKATAEREALEAEQVVSISSSKETVSENNTAAASQEASNAADTSSNNQPAANTEVKPVSQPAAQSSSQTLSVQATGYSTKQPNLSTHTATGIDLRINPRVIAVDPSVIPLGSMVEVEGMGIYIAGDTGGAIKGNIIDIHFETVAQALQWGRRNVTIRILK